MKKQGGSLNLLSGKRAFIILAEGTTNTLTDGTGGGHKGALYCKGKLLFNGSGLLSATADPKRFTPGPSLRGKGLNTLMTEWIGRK